MHAGNRTNAVDALFTRIAESAVEGTGAKLAGDRSQRKKAKAKKQELLKQWAIATGNWHTSVNDFTNATEPAASGKDSDVYGSKEEGFVVKFSKGKDDIRFSSDIDAVNLFNYVFPSTAYDILGYGDIDGQFVTVLRQPTISIASALTEDERVEYMRSLGFNPINDAGTAFSNGDIVVSDLQKGNIVHGTDGKIYVIDADVKLHTKDTGGNYTYPPASVDTESRINIGNSEKNVVSSQSNSNEKGNEQGEVAGIPGESSSLDEENEAATILRTTGHSSTTQDGQGSRSKESLLRELAERASRSNQWINDVMSIVSSPIGKGGENETYLSRDGESAIKVNDFSYLPDNSANFDSFMNRVDAHNELFPHDAITILGFTRNSKGKISVVLSQPYISNAREATQEEIDSFLEGMDFYTDMSGNWTDGTFDIADTKLDNVLVDADGNLHFIDVLPYDSRKPGKMLVIPKARTDTYAVPQRQDGENLLDYAGRVAKAREIDDARKKVEQNPTEAQKEAGNYRKGHVSLDGYDITIENPKGSVRSGRDASGQEWSVTMNNDYGYIRGTEGVDGDHIDVFLSDDPTQGDVYVVDQVNPGTGEFDEHKVMYGFNSVDEACEAYLSNYSPGWKGLGTVTKVSREEFRKWVDSSHRKMKPFAEYKSVQKENELKRTGRSGKNEDGLSEKPGSRPERELTNNSPVVESTNSTTMAYVTNYGSDIVGYRATGNAKRFEKGRIVDAGPAIQITFEHNGRTVQQTIYAKSEEALDGLKAWANSWKNYLQARKEEDGQGDVLFREVEEANERFNDELDAFKAKTHKGLLHLGQPGRILNACGINMELTLSPTVLSRKLKQHGLNVDDIKGLAGAIQEPILVYQHGDIHPNTVIVTDLTANEGKVSVAVELDGEGNVVELNNISSVHSKDATTELERLSNMRDGYLEQALRWVDKNKVSDWLGIADLNSPIHANNPKLISTANILQNFENPSITEGNLRRGEGTLTDDGVSVANDPAAKMTGRSSRTAAQRRAFAERERQRMTQRVQELAGKLHLDNVDIVTDAGTLQGKRAEAKGFFSRRTGKITIVIPNHTSVYDAEQTLLHEAVAHYGLRQLFGEHFDTFLDNVFRNADVDVRRRIVDLAKKHGWDTRTATEEYLASLAENTDFGNVNAGWWSRIKELFLQMLHRIGFEDFSGVTLSDNELRYILWRSYENLREPGSRRSILGEAADVVMQNELKVGNYAPAGGIPIGQVAEARETVKAERIRKLRDSKPVEITGNEYQGKYELNRDSDKQWIKDNEVI